MDPHHIRPDHASGTLVSVSPKSAGWRFLGFEAVALHSGEVYVPGGAWSGWPPHGHDGRLGSAYLEETYYDRVRPDSGFAVHRNYLREEAFDELFTVRNGDLGLVTQGFHPVAAAPGSSVYFLNFLAGELIAEDRATPPVDDPDHAWIEDDWEQVAMQLPVTFENAE